MRTRLQPFVLAALLALAVAAAPKSAMAQVTNTNPVPITGTVEGGGTFTGLFDIQRFAVQRGALVAIGTLTGTLRDSAGLLLGTVTERVVLPLLTLWECCSKWEVNFF